MNKVLTLLKKNREARYVVYLILGILILEVSLMNLKHWKTLSYDPVDAGNYEIEVGPGLQKDGDVYTVTDANLAYLKFGGLDLHVDNMYVEAYQDNQEPVYVCMKMTDEANKELIDAGASTIAYGVFQTNYLDLNLSGKSTELAIHFTGYGAKLNIGEIIFNKTVPFTISFLRMGVELLIGLFFILFRPGCAIYRIKLLEAHRYKKVLIIGIVTVSSLMMIATGFLIQPDKNITANTLGDWPCNEEYVELANAMLDGHVYLDREAPASLANAENPYDPVNRQKTLLAAGEEFKSDYAYYNGKLYCYFGALPVVLFYIPFKVLTGHDLRTWYLVTALTVLFCVAAFWFLYELCKRYFKKTTLGAYLLSGLFMIFGSAVVYLVFIGLIYSVPIICSILFGLVGVTLWMTASRDGKIIKWRIGVGSLIMAFILGCRPQMVLIFLLAVPIFWKETITDRQFFSKKGLVNTAVIMLPFVLVGAVVMYYNAVRFGSPFDFGANYNLTSNDMTHRGWNNARFPLGFFFYLFQPFTMSGAYPFMHLCSQANDYLGRTNYEPLMGGLFAYNTLAVVNLFVFKFRKQLMEKRAFLLALLPNILGLIVMAMDVQMAGLTQRYASDFFWLMTIATVIMLFQMEESVHQQNNQVLVSLFRWGFVIGVFACIFFNCWSTLIDYRYYDLRSSNPEFYYTVKCLLPFY